MGGAQTDERAIKAGNNRWDWTLTNGCVLTGGWALAGGLALTGGWTLTVHDGARFKNKLMGVMVYF